MKSSVAEPATSPVAYRDLREWLDHVNSMGELKTLRGVHWDREMGAMVEMCYRRRGSRTAALLFDDVPGYPSGYRCLYGMMCSPKRFAFTIGDRGSCGFGDTGLHSANAPRESGELSAMG